MAKIRYVVQCNRHGVESKDWAGKQVAVPKPLTGKDRKEGGCPFCKKEQRESLDHLESMGNQS